MEHTTDALKAIYQHFAALTQTLLFKVIILFAFALSTFLGLSYHLLKDAAERESTNQEIRYKQITSTINAIMRSNGTLKDIISYLQDLGFESAGDDAESHALRAFLGSQHHLRGFLGVSVKGINTAKGIYIMLETPMGALLYHLSIQKRMNHFYALVLGGILLLCAMFGVILRGLLPIKRLQKEIRKFGAGELNIKCDTHRGDEIGDLSREFEKAAKTIKALQDSRTMFLRSIMHELRTPITKGRIIAEMLESKTAKERLCKVFNRLNNLIDEFAKIEQMSAKRYKVKKIEFLANDLIRYCEGMLLVENRSPILLLSPSAVLKADFDLMGMAVKNLLDNAIKYGEEMDGEFMGLGAESVGDDSAVASKGVAGASKIKGATSNAESALDSKNAKLSADSKNAESKSTKAKKILVQVSAHKDKLYIINSGMPLPQSLDEHAKPYFKGGDARGGLGLGMYIIQNTLAAQGFRLDYTHKDGKNIFTISGCVVENYCNIEDRLKILEQNMKKRGADEIRANEL